MANERTVSGPDLLAALVAIERLNNNSQGARPERPPTDLEKRVEGGLQAAASALCIGYSPDYYSALWDVIRALAPDQWQQITDGDEGDEDPLLREMAQFEDD